MKFRFDMNIFYTEKKLLQKQFKVVSMLLSGLPLYLETWKNLEFDNFGKNNLEKPGILIKIPGKTWNF